MLDISNSSGFSRQRKFAQFDNLLNIQMVIFPVTHQSVILSSSDRNKVILWGHDCGNDFNQQPFTSTALQLQWRREDFSGSRGFAGLDSGPVLIPD